MVLLLKSEDFVRALLAFSFYISTIFLPVLFQLKNGLVFGSAVGSWTRKIDSLTNFRVLFSIFVFIWLFAYLTVELSRIQFPHNNRMGIQSFVSNINSTARAAILSFHPSLNAIIAKKILTLAALSWVINDIHAYFASKSVIKRFLNSVICT